MQKSHKLQLHCQACKAPMLFSVLEPESFRSGIVCAQCGQKHAFEDKLADQLQQFESLCRQIHASEGILGETSIAIDVENHHVMVPFNILLTRLSSVMELNMGGKKTLVSFRVEPLKDI